MKTKSHSKITFSQAVNGYLLAAQSRHLSQHTIDEYLNTFRKFQTSLDDDPPLITLSPADVQAFLAAQTVSKKTILNYHIGLSALWTWAVNEGWLSSTSCTRSSALSRKSARSRSARPPGRRCGATWRCRRQNWSAAISWPRRWITGGCDRLRQSIDCGNDGRRRTGSAGPVLRL